MQKRVLFFSAAIGATLAVALSYLYAKNNYGWLLALTCVAVALTLACVAILLYLSRKNASPQQSVYSRKREFVSRSELEFLHTLRTMLGNRYAVCVQVPLVSVIEKRAAAFRNELFRVIDYMIVDSVSYEPLLLIELNDASHNRADRAERDRKVAEICAAANMPLVTFTLAESKNPIEVKKRIFKYL